jgi:hypothetical protein
MMDVQEVIRWLGTLNQAGNVAVDDGGLALFELDREGNPTGAYLEVGGIPLEAEEDEPA